MQIFPVLFAIGWLILGLVLIRFLPAPASRLADEAGKSPVLRTILGLCVLVFSVVVLIILAISIVGMPFAIPGAALLVLGIIIGPLAVSLRFGRLVAGLFQKTVPDWAAFSAGFVFIAVLVWIPFVGIIVLVVVISLGLGAIAHASRAYCPHGTGGYSGRS